MKKVLLLSCLLCGGCSQSGPPPLRHPDLDADSDNLDQRWFPDLYRERVEAERKLHDAVARVRLTEKDGGRDAAAARDEALRLQANLHDIERRIATQRRDKLDRLEAMDREVDEKRAKDARWP